MDEDLLHDLLEKYRQGTLTAAEKARLDAWYDRFDSTYAGLQPFVSPLAEQEAEQRLRARIENSVDAATQQTAKVAPLRRWWYGAAAAVLLLALAVPLYKWQVKHGTQPPAPPIAWQNIATPSGKMTRLTLADGSKIWLNANSRMRYPAVFAANSREVWLNDGEAFFDISPDKQRPFIVHTGKLNIKVLGTAFNIRAYTQINKVSIGVASGKVQVAQEARQLGVLTESKQLDWNRDTQAASIHESDATHMGNWKEGLLRLDGASFTELSVMIKNVYGYQLNTRNKAVQQASFTATFRNSNQIEDVMKMICRTQQVKYQKQDSTITLY